VRKVTTRTPHQLGLFRGNHGVAASLRTRVAAWGQPLSPRRGVNGSLGRWTAAGRFRGAMPAPPSKSITYQHGTLDDEAKSSGFQFLKRNTAVAPKPFDREDGSNLGLNVTLFDAMNRLLRQPDLPGKLILAQAQDRPHRPKLGCEHGPLNTHRAVELRPARIKCCPERQLHFATHQRLCQRSSPRRGSPRRPTPPGGIIWISKPILRDHHGTMSRWTRNVVLTTFWLLTLNTPGPMPAPGDAAKVTGPLSWADSNLL
jgi:hypothetical protein